MAKFTMESRTRDGKLLAYIPFRNLQGEFRYNTIQNIRFDISMEFLLSLTHEHMYPGITEVVLYRNNKRIFCGPLWNMQVTSSENRATCSASGIESYLELRITGLEGESTGTRGELAWSMIDRTQKQPYGDLFITRGTRVPDNGPVEKKKWKTYETLYSTHEDLTSGSDGFDWVITPDRVYNQYYPKISSMANAVLSTKSNIRNYSIGYNGKYAANWFITLGKESAKSNVLIDTNSRNKYGLRQFVESNSSVTSIPSLNGLNEARMAMRREAKVTPQISTVVDGISPFDGDVSYGQMIKVYIDSGWDSVSQVMRCTGFQLTVGKNFEETYVLYLNDDREVDNG